MTSTTEISEYRTTEGNKNRNSQRGMCCASSFLTKNVTTPELMDLVSRKVPASMSFNVYLLENQIHKQREGNKAFTNSDTGMDGMIFGGSG